MESPEHNWANISETICPKLLIFGEQAPWTLFFQNILTNPIISQISFSMTSHFGTLFRPGENVRIDQVSRFVSPVSKVIQLAEFPVFYKKRSIVPSKHSLILSPTDCFNIVVESEKIIHSWCLWFQFLVRMKWMPSSPCPVAPQFLQPLNALASKLIGKFHKLM